MSRATLDDAIDELVALLRDANEVPRVAGVDTVYDYLPPRTTLAGATCVCVHEVGITAESWQIAVRVFKNVTADPRTAQKEMRLLLPAIDAATFSDAGFGPSNWTIGEPSTDPQILEAVNVYDVGRQDYY